MTLGISPSSPFNLSWRCMSTPQRPRLALTAATPSSASSVGLLRWLLALPSYAIGGSAQATG